MKRTLNVVVISCVPRQDSVKMVVVFGSDPKL
jgi:hypothetical protein